MHWSASLWPPRARWVAAVSGEARAFFLLPTLLPAVLMLVFLGSVVVHRPLTGTLFNRMVGGPRDWRQHSALLRVYSITTLVAVAIHAVNFAVRIVFYLADQPAVLAAVQIAAGPVFAEQKAPQHHLPHADDGVQPPTRPLSEPHHDTSGDTRVTNL